MWRNQGPGVLILASPPLKVGKRLYQDNDEESDTGVMDALMGPQEVGGNDDGAYGI